MPSYISTAVNKIIKKGSLFAIILLYQLSYTQTVSAGFYDWLASTPEQTSLIVSPITSDEINYTSFGKIFSWNNRTPENQNSIKTFIAEKQKEKPEPEFKVIKTYTVRATAYSSTPDQTDSTPFITAKGTNVRDGIVAANFLPFNTKIRIPDIYGNKIFVVEDRMNRRYWHNIDIWFPERSLALEFGSQRVTIEIIEES